MQAAIIRNNEILLKVAARAVRLREIGRQLDEHSGHMNDLWSKNPDMPRSSTTAFMLSQSYSTALAAFDDAVLEAASNGFDWLRENQRLGPHLVPTPTERSE